MINKRRNFLNRIILITAVVCFFAGINPVSAQKVYTIDEAIITAIRNNNETKIAILEVDKAHAAVHEAFGYALPSVELSGNFAHFLEKPKTPFPDFEAMLNNAVYGVLFRDSILTPDPSKLMLMNTKLQSFALANSYEAKAQVTQILFNSAVFRGIGASEIYLNASKELLNANVNKTVLNIRKAFYGVMLTKEMLKIMNESLQNARDNLGNLKKMYEQGFASEYDVLQVEVQVENLNPTVVDLENALKGAKDGLKVLMGVPQTEDIDIAGEFTYTDEELPEENYTLKKALADNLDLKSLDWKMQVDNAMIDLDRAEYWPTIAAFGNYSYAGSSDNLNFQNYSSAMVGLTFSINLFQGNQTASRIEKSTITYNQTREQLAMLREATSAQVKSKVLELQKVKSLIAAHDRTIKLAERTYNIAKTRFREGTGTQLEIKNADMEIRTAKTNRLQSVYSYIIAKSELESLMGITEAKYLDEASGRIKED